MPKHLLEALEPLLKTLEALSSGVRAYEHMLAGMVEQCADVQPLLTIHGVGELTAMAYIRTLEDWRQRVADSPTGHAGVSGVRDAASVPARRGPLRTCAALACSAPVLDGSAFLMRPVRTT